MPMTNIDEDEFHFKQYTNGGSAPIKSQVCAQTMIQRAQFK